MQGKINGLFREEKPHLSKETQLISQSRALSIRIQQKNWSSQCLSFLRSTIFLFIILRGCLPWKNGYVGSFRFLLLKMHCCIVCYNLWLYQQKKTIIIRLLDWAFMLACGYVICDMHCSEEKDHQTECLRCISSQVMPIFFFFFLTPSCNASVLVTKRKSGCSRKLSSEWRQGSEFHLVVSSTPAFFERAQNGFRLLSATLQLIPRLHILLFAVKGQP